MSQANKTKQILINKLGLSELPEDKQEELLAKMMEVLFKRLFVETLEVLGEANREEYKKMIDEEAPAEEVEKFLKEKIKDYDKFVERIMDEFVEDMQTITALEK